MFWKDPKSIEPLRQYRWLLSNGAGVWVWAKSVKLPAYSVETQKYQVGNHKIEYPGLLEWQDVTLTIVDVKAEKQETRSLGLFNKLKPSGYNIEGAGDGMSKSAMSSVIKSIFGSSTAQLSIQQIDSDGKKMQGWILYQPLIKDVSFGQLDYSNDELITIDLTIAYDHAKLEK